MTAFRRWHRCKSAEGKHTSFSFDILVVRNLRSLSCGVLSRTPTRSSDLIHWTAYIWIWITSTNLHDVVLRDSSNWLCNANHIQLWLTCIINICFVLTLDLYQFPALYRCWKEAGFDSYKNMSMLFKHQLKHTWLWYGWSNEMLFKTTLKY